MSWLDTYSKSLSGRRVVVIPDDDESGYKHADRVLGSLIRHGVLSVRVVVLPGLKEHGDVSDWLASGGTRQGLIALAKMSKEYASL